MALVELSDLGPGAPADVAVAGLVQISICYLFETAKAVESRCQFAGERLVLEEPALRRQADRLLVQRHGLDVPSFEAPPLRREGFGRNPECSRLPTDQICIYGRNPGHLLTRATLGREDRRAPSDR